MLVLASLFVAGCHGHPHEGDEHPHEGDDHPGGGHGHGDGVAIGITQWSDDGLELFAEHPPAVVGQEVPFLAHVTVLEDFSALEDARVRLTLTGPDELAADAPMLRSGIYRPAVTPRRGRCSSGKSP